jgi:hypothetical protein
VLSTKGFRDVIVDPNFEIALLLEWKLAGIDLEIDFSGTSKIGDA